MKMLLEAKNLTYGTPDGRVLQRGLNFGLGPGQMLLIKGSNGCGKSTLLRTMLGEMKEFEGSYRYDFPFDTVGYLPQLENTEVHLPLKLGDVLDMACGRRVSWDAIASFGLLRREQLDTAWNTASGGERKRILLTRALLRRPRVLFFDEPMNHLDRESRAVMIGVMSRFLKESTARSERAIVMVCHQGIREEEKALFDLVTLDLDGATRATEILC